jgi:two-component system alkaline phosphatase synthesis response regulator PhoP
MPKKILVVDDEAHIRQALQATLESEGYMVFTAENGKQGVDKAKAVKPDLVILDVRMPIMDGHMASIEIRYDESLKDIRFMFLSANADEDSRNYAFGHGAEEYMTKPFKVAELLERVARILAPPVAPVPPPSMTVEPAPAPSAPPAVHLDEAARNKYLEEMKRKFAR